MGRGSWVGGRRGGRPLDDAATRSRGSGAQKEEGTGSGALPVGNACTGDGWGCEAAARHCEFHGVRAVREGGRAGRAARRPTWRLAVVGPAEVAWTVARSGLSRARAQCL